MTPDAPTPTPAPAPDPSNNKRKSPGIIAQKIKDEIKVATDCYQICADEPAILAALMDRQYAGHALLGASIERCGALIIEVTAKRGAGKTRTTEEMAAREALLDALNPVIIAARDKYPKGSAERANYGLGENLDATSTGDLLALVDFAFTQLSGTAPKDTLEGLKPAEIALLGTLHDQYKNADWAQGKAQRTAEQALADLQAEVDDVLKPLRRKCQNKADLAFPHTDTKNRTTRKAFHLPPDKRATD
jgi:hypothetical protein